LTSTNPTAHLLHSYTEMFFRPNKALLFAGKKLKSTYKSLELTTATGLPTVIHHTVLLSSMTSYKVYHQTSTTSHTRSTNRVTVVQWFSNFF